MHSVKLDLGDDMVDVEVEVVGPLPRPESALTPVTKQGGGAGTSERVAAEVFSRAIRAVGSRLRAELVALADPDEMTLEFGASLKGGATVLLSAEGTFKVQLKWTKRPS